jgi:CRISPR system Cascade subunit CasC
MTLVREKGQPVSLANAFERPVRPGRDGGVIQPSVQALDVYWGKLAAAYGLAGDGKLFFVNVDDIETAYLPKASRISTADELVAKTVAALG